MDRLCLLGTSKTRTCSLNSQDDMEIVEIQDDRDGVDGDAESYVVVELRIVGYPTRAREVCNVFY